MGKQCWNFVIAAALVIGMFPIRSSAAATSGSCGDGVYWDYDEDTGTITISGEGTTDNFDALVFQPDGTLDITDPAPWEPLKESIRSVVVEEGVFSIGKHAFDGCLNLQHLELPRSLVSIGNYAFLYCWGLEQVVIPENVKSLGCNAFLGNELEGLPYVYFLGDAPEVKASGEINRTFSNGTTLFYLPRKSGWSAPSWNGYAVDTWDGHELTVPDDRPSQEQCFNSCNVKSWNDPWLTEQPGAGETEIEVCGTQRYTYAYEVAERVNALRAGADLSPLTLDDSLTRVAMQRAAECAVHYSHTRPNNTDCMDVFPPEGTMGENIAAGQLTPEEVMDSWTSSPGHYKNMTGADYTKIGVGCFESGGHLYWAQAFASGESDKHIKTADQEASVPVIVSQEHFSLCQDNEALSLQIGESVPLPLYVKNTNFYNEKTMIRASNINCRYPSAIAVSFHPLTVTGKEAGSGELTVTLSNNASTVIPVSVAPPLWDVPQASWYYDAVTWADSRALIDRLSPGLFSPDSQMSRGATAIMLYRLESSPKADRQTSFSDVREEELIAAANWANNAGLMNGYGNGSFGPEDPLTREQMAAILFRYNAYKGNAANDRSDLSGYLDTGEISSYAVEAMAWANAQGLVQGTGGAKLSPKKETTRAEAAAIFMRFCGQ